MKNILVDFVNGEPASAGLGFVVVLASIAIAVIAVVRSFSKKIRAPRASAKPQMRPHGTGKACVWRETLPPAGEVHVASIIQIAEARKARRLQGVP